MPTVKNSLIAWIIGLFCLVFSLQANSDGRTDAIELVNDAETTFHDFVSDPNMGWFRDNVGEAKALVIVPQLLKAGFIFGASGGNGVVMVKDKATESWSNPAFYSVGSVTWGLQIGGEVAEVIMLVMTEGGMNSLLSTKLQLGGDASVAAGPVGAGARSDVVADLITFSRARGVFGGLNLDGTVIAPSNDWNNTYFGKTVTPPDILIRGTARNKKADPLLAQVTKATK